MKTETVFFLGKVHVARQNLHLFCFFPIKAICCITYYYFKFYRLVDMDGTCHTITR